MAQQLSGWATPPEVGEKRKQLPTVKTFPGEGAEEAEGERKDETRKREGLLLLEPGRRRNNVEGFHLSFCESSQSSLKGRVRDLSWGVPFFKIFALVERNVPT